MKKIGTRGIDSFMVSLVTIKQIVTWITGDYSFHPTLLPLPDWIKDLGMECSPRLLKKKPWMGFSGGSDGKESACNVGDLGSIPGLGRSPGEGVATHLSIVAWRIPWTEEPGGLQSLGLQSQTRLSDLKKKKKALDQCVSRKLAVSNHIPLCVEGQRRNQIVCTIAFIFPLLSLLSYLSWFSGAQTPVSLGSTCVSKNISVTHQC